MEDPFESRSHELESIDWVTALHRENMSEKTGGESTFQVGCCPECGCNVVAIDEVLDREQGDLEALSKFTNQALQGIIERMRNFESAQQTKPDQRRGEFIELRVAKAIPSDVGHGRVRLPLDNHLGLKPGDAVCIQGATGPLASRGRTSAIVWRARPEDSNIGVARFDGVIRKNAKVGLGQKVRIRKVNPEPCSELILAPELEGERLNDLTSYFRRFKIGKGASGFALRGLNKRPMERGDIVFVPGLSLVGEALPFRVRDTNPRGIVTIGPETSITIQHPETEGGERGPEESSMVAQNQCCKAASHPPESKSGPDRCALQGEGDMDPDVEALGLVLRELGFPQRQLMHIIARLISKSDVSDSKPREKRTH